MSHLELILNPGIFSACFYKILVAISSVSRSKPFLKMSNTFSEPYLHFCDSSAYVHHASYEWHNLVQCTATFFTIIFIKWVSWDSNSFNGTLSVVVSQYRRLLSTTIVRAQAQCLISRIGVIAPQARDAARRREVAGRMERQMREERRANWMASLAGPGSARRGRCHTLIWFLDILPYLCNW